MVSRREVAERANVSIRTVSNVASGFSHVAPETRDRVLKAMEEFGYRPSEFARSLKIGRSGIIGLMLPELDTPYFAELTRAFVERGVELGLTIVVDQTDGNRSREEEALRRTSDGALFDALVLNPLALRPHDLDGFQTGPLVLLGEEDFPGFDKVMIDNYLAAQEVVHHLVAQGRTHIAAIGAERNSHGSSTLRLAGYRAAMHDLPGGSGSKLVEYVDAFRRIDGAEAMRRLLLQRHTKPIDAVFCFSDPLALGAMRALHEAGIRVPDDIAIVGWDDTEDGRFAYPSLTTVSPDKTWIAYNTLARVEQHLNGMAKTAETLIGPYRLIIRESSA